MGTVLLEGLIGGESPEAPIVISNGEGLDLGETAVDGFYDSAADGIGLIGVAGNGGQAEDAEGAECGDGDSASGGAENNFRDPCGQFAAMTDSRASSMTAGGTYCSNLAWTMPLASTTKVQGSVGSPQSWTDSTRPPVGRPPSMR